MLKLTERQQRILAAAHLRANLSPAVIARELKLQERTVRYHLQRLLSLGAVRCAPFLNIYPLGYRYYNVYFSHDALSAAELEKIIKRLHSSDQVSWLAELGGDFHLGIAIAARSPDECLQVLYGLSEDTPGLFLNKEIIIHRSLAVYAAKYLAPDLKPKRELGYGACASKPPSSQAVLEIDELDHAILRNMSNKQLTSSRAISRATGKPHSSIALRLQRLSAGGVIAGHWYPIDSKKLGYQTLKLLIYCKGADRRLSEEMRAYAGRHAHIVYLIECLGSWDFELGLDVRTDAGVADIVADISNTFRRHISLVKVVPMFRVLKWDLYPFKERREL